ncbi:unnamed protein product [Zymoseptoria tritici ST99CH_1A5]|uniref:Uncharacterized protein n=1 Tax=Zymoseptoria tritici ST99CH_1A5 TaxID=1276529 RepID=A0A1Y6L875_ZYMTR|nr:unnamed protein product [Zymoseptoria tritici ST99CH_1A5]
MDGWQAVQNWTIFGVVAGGLVYYYYPKSTPVHKAVPIHDFDEVKKEVKKAVRKPVAAAKNAVPSALVQDTQNVNPSGKENGNKKRKATTQPSLSPPAPAAQEDDDDEIDMSTRQFAANMKKAREGIDMKKVESKDTRVKTVKAKSMTSPILSSGSSQTGDAEDDWAPAGKAGAVDDMLEPTAPGPKALKITASSQPTKEKVNRAAKQEVVETKKQRQNRRKKEAEQEARQEAERIRKVEAEQQLRAARIARGEPAKNGIPIPAAPAKNQWTEQNGARQLQQSATASSGNNTALLDTFDAESTGSSNAGASTAATSIADGAQSEDNNFAKAIDESGQETGWNEVKTSKKSKKKDSQVETNGSATPVAAPVKAAPAVKQVAPGTKPKGFQALTDEYEQRADVADPNDASNWDA